MSKKEKVVNLNKETFDLISKMSAIQPSIIFEKNDKGILVNRANTSTTIAFRMQFPESHFNFDGDEVCFLNFPEFYQMLSVLNKPNVTQVVDNNHEMFVLSENTSKIRYLVSDPESLKKGPENIDWKNPDAVIALTKSDLKELTKAIGLVAADTIRFSVETGKTDLVLSVTKGPNDNTYEKVFKLTFPAASTFDLAIEAEFLLMLPDNDASLEIDKKGLVRVSFETNEVNVEMFTGEVEED